MGAGWRASEIRPLQICLPTLARFVADYFDQPVVKRSETHHLSPKASGAKRAASTMALGIDRSDEMVYILPIASLRTALMHTKK